MIGILALYFSFYHPFELSIVARSGCYLSEIALKAHWSFVWGALDTLDRVGMGPLRDDLPNTRVYAFVCDWVLS